MCACAIRKTCTICSATRFLIEKQLNRDVFHLRIPLRLHRHSIYFKSVDKRETLGRCHDVRLLHLLCTFHINWILLLLLVHRALHFGGFHLSIAVLFFLCFSYCRLCKFSTSQQSCLQCTMSNIWSTTTCHRNMCRQKFIIISTLNTLYIKRSNRFHVYIATYYYYRHAATAAHAYTLYNCTHIISFGSDRHVYTSPKTRICYCVKRKRWVEYVVAHEVEWIVRISLSIRYTRYYIFKMK